MEFQQALSEYPSRGEIHPHLSLRLKVLDEPQAKKLIEKTAATIANEGKLRMFVGPSGLAGR